MAAHLVVELPLSQETTTFSGTSEEQAAYLKILWKSIHLNPTIESRLISSDIRQRTKVAQQNASAKHSYSFREADPPKLTEFFGQVSMLEAKDQMTKRLRVLKKRDAIINSHKQKEKNRVEIQKKSGQEIVVGMSPLPIVPPISPDSYRLGAEDQINSQDDMNELDKFDQTLG